MADLWNRAATGGRSRVVYSDPCSWRCVCSALGAVDSFRDAINPIGLDMDSLASGDVQLFLGGFRAHQSRRFPVRPN